MSKVMGILSNFGTFTMLAHQIWSSHVTQDANFEKSFVLVLHLILGKVTEFPVEKLSSSEVSYQQENSLEKKTQKTHWVETPPPPVPLGLSNFIAMVTAQNVTNSVMASKMCLKDESLKSESFSLTL